MATPFLDGLMAALRDARSQVPQPQDRASQRRSFQQDPTQQPTPTAAPPAQQQPPPPPAAQPPTPGNNPIWWAQQQFQQAVAQQQAAGVMPNQPLDPSTQVGPPMPASYGGTPINPSGVAPGPPPPAGVPVPPGQIAPPSYVPPTNYGAYADYGQVNRGVGTNPPPPQPVVAGNPADRTPADTGTGAVAPPLFTKDTPGVVIDDSGTPTVKQITPELLANLPQDAKDAYKDQIAAITQGEQLKAQGKLSDSQQQLLDNQEQQLIVSLNSEQANRNDVYMQRTGQKGDPLMQIIHDPVGAIESGVGTVFGALDKPRQEAVTLQGDLVYQAAKGGLPAWLAQGNALIGKLTMPMGTPLNDMLVWESKNPQAVIDAYEKGYDANGDGKPDYTGGRAVWELFQSQRNMAQRAAGDILSDPLNLLPAAGAIGKAAQTGRAAEDAGLVRRAASGALQGVAKGGEIANRVVNFPADVIFKGGGEAVRGANTRLAELLGKDAVDRTPLKTGEELLKSPLGQQQGIIHKSIRTAATEETDAATRARANKSLAESGAARTTAEAGMPANSAAAVPEQRPVSSEPVQTRLVETNPRTGELRITEQAKAGTPAGTPVAPASDTRPSLYVRNTTTDTGTRVAETAVRDTPEGGMVFDAPPSTTPQEVVVQDASGARAVREVAPSEEPTPVVLTPDELRPNPTHTAPDYQATTPNAIPQSEKRYHKIVTQYGDTLPGQTDLFVEEVNKADDALKAAQAARGGRTSPIDSARFNVAVERAFQNAYAGTDAALPGYAFRNGRGFDPATGTPARAVEQAVFNPSDTVARRARAWLYQHGQEDLALAAKDLRAERLAIPDQTAARVPLSPEGTVVPPEPASPAGSVANPEQPVVVTQPAATQTAEPPLTPASTPAAAPPPEAPTGGQPIQRAPMIDEGTQEVLSRTFQKHDLYTGQTYEQVMNGMEQGLVQDARDLAAIRNLQTQGPISKAQQKLIDRLDAKYGALGDLVTQERDLNGRLHWVPNPDYKVENYVRNAFEQAQLVERGYQPPTGFVRWYDKRVIGTFSKLRLLAPWNFVHYALGNVIGDSTQMAMAGKSEAVFDQFREWKPLTKLAFNRDYSIIDSPLGDTVAKMSRASDPRLFHSNMTDALVGEDALRLARRIRGKTSDTWIKKAPRAYTEAMANLSNGSEWARRAALGNWELQVESAARRSDLIERAQVMAKFPGGRGWDGLDAADVKAAIDTLPPIFSPEDVRRSIEQVGAAKGLPAKKVAGYAEQVGRQWANIQHQIEDKVVGEVNRVLFDYKYTNADEILRRVVPFHFWATRALPFYVEQGMRHPGLMAAYFRMSNGLARANEHADIPPWLKNQLGLWNTPAGYALFWNPLAAVGVISLMDQSTDSSPKGESVFGRLLRETRDTAGVTLYPWFTSALNTFGLMGDTVNGLDPFGTSKDRKLFGAVVQYMAEQGWLGPNKDKLLGKPFEQYLIDARALVSGAVGNPIAATDANNSPRNQLMTIIMEDIRQRDGLASGQPLSMQQLQEANDALSNPDDPLYQQALHSYATEGLRLNSVNLVVPGYVQRSLTAQNTTYAASKDPTGGLGQLWRPTDPYADGQITPDEQAWLDAYKQQTGKEYQPGDLLDATERAKLTQEIATSTPAHNKLALALAEQRHLGTPGQQLVYTTWSGIAYGTPAAPVSILGRTWQPAEITAMPSDQRLQLADQWTAEDPKRYADYQQVRDLRDAYQQAHPELQSYRDWTKQVNQYATPAQYRFEISRTNPNAARYFQQERAYFRQKNPNASPSEVEAYLDKVTVTQGAYEAVNGIQGSKTLPLSTGPGMMIAGAGPQQGGGGSDVAKLQKSVLDYQQKVGQANAYLTQMYGFPVDVSQLPDGIVLQTALAQLPPGYFNGTSTARAYLQWQAQQQYLGQPSDPATYLAQQKGQALLPGMIQPPVATTPPA